MMYPDLTFPTPKSRPYFYTNFVSTVDGKVVVTIDPKAYWPIGSATDHTTMYQLRTYADCLIHGTATASGHSTLTSLKKPEFRAQRLKNGKPAVMPYIVMGREADHQLFSLLKDNGDIPTTFVTTADDVVSGAPAGLRIERMGKSRVDLERFAAWLFEQGYRHVLVEGGPHIMGSFFEAGLIDEIFITIAPKIFGNKDQATMTMVEGFLFAPDKVPHMGLVSATPHENEVYLRYKVKH